MWERWLDVGHFIFLPLFFDKIYPVWPIYTASKYLSLCLILLTVSITLEMITKTRSLPILSILTHDIFAVIQTNYFCAFPLLPMKKVCGAGITTGFHRFFLDIRISAPFSRYTSRWNIETYGTSLRVASFKFRNFLPV